MRMDRYDKYKKYKMSSRTERFIRAIENVYNNMIDYAASFVALLDDYIDMEYSVKVNNLIRRWIYE